MGHPGDTRRRGGCLIFLTEFKALLIKMLLLTKRKRTQTIVMLLLATHSVLERTPHAMLLKSESNTAEVSCTIADSFPEKISIHS